MQLGPANHFADKVIQREVLSISLIDVHFVSHVQVSGLKDRLAAMQDQTESLDNAQAQLDRDRASLDDQLKKTQLLLQQVRPGPGQAVEQTLGCDDVEMQ